MPCPIPFRVRGSRNFSARGQRLEDILNAIANGCLARAASVCDHLVPLRYSTGSPVFARRMYSDSLALRCLIPTTS